MPTDRQQRCKKCGKRFTRPQGTNRLYCFDCKPERKAAMVTNLPGTQSHDQLGEDQDQDGPLTRYTRKTLEEADVLETWQGAAVMALALLIDTGKHGASGAAGTIKAHREAMSVALADSGTDADVIDLIFSESGS